MQKSIRLEVIFSSKFHHMSVRDWMIKLIISSLLFSRAFIHDPLLWTFWRSPMRPNLAFTWKSPSIETKRCHGTLPGYNIFMSIELQNMPDIRFYTHNDHFVLREPILYLKVWKEKAIFWENKVAFWKLFLFFSMARIVQCRTWQHIFLWMKASRHVISYIKDI